MIDTPPNEPAAETTPVEETRTAGLLLLHVPPAGVLDRASVLAAQVTDGPVIGDGICVTDTTLVAAQAPPNVYEIVTRPAVTPQAVPEVPTVAIAVLLLLHTPSAGDDA